MVEDGRGDRLTEPEDFSVAGRLDKLIRLRERRLGRTLTYRQLAADVEALTGTKVSHSYLRRLRSGAATNPGVEYLEALAKYFGVLPRYFVDDPEAAKSHYEQLALADALSDSGVFDIAARVSELSPRGIRAIRKMVEALIEHERAGGVTGRPEHEPDEG